MSWTARAMNAHSRGVGGRVNPTRRFTRLDHRQRPITTTAIRSRPTG
jgi:hypothetical protein